jgi:hypothetical protein
MRIFIFAAICLRMLTYGAERQEAFIIYSGFIAQFTTNSKKRMTNPPPFSGGGLSVATDAPKILIAITPWLTRPRVPE